MCTFVLVSLKGTRSDFNPMFWSCILFRFVLNTVSHFILGIFSKNMDYRVSEYVNEHRLRSTIRLVSQLAGALSPVNHGGLHQGWKVLPYDRQTLTSPLDSVLSDRNLACAFLTVHKTLSDSEVKAMCSRSNCTCCLAVVRQCPIKKDQSLTRMSE